MAYYEIGREERGIEISVPAGVQPRCSGLVIHRRRRLERRHIEVNGAIRVTNPVLTLVDFAATHGRDQVEQAVNDADRVDVIDPERLRFLLDDYTGWNGARLLRRVLDIRTFTMTDSELERRMRPIIRRVGLSKPLTQHRLNGFKSTSTGRRSASSSKPTAFATTGRRRSRPKTGSATRSTPPPAELRCASPVPRSASTPATSRKSSVPSRSG
jgi:hypothetical protein